MSRKYNNLSVTTRFFLTFSSNLTSNHLTSNLTVHVFLKYYHKNNLGTTIQNLLHKQIAKGLHHA